MATDTAPPIPSDDAKVRAAEAGMAAAGQPVTESAPVDYFAFEETHRYTLPDGKQWIEFRVLNEGQRKQFQNTTNRDVRFTRGSGDAIMRMAPGDERHELLRIATVDWSLFKGGAPFPYNKSNVAVFLDKFPPKIIDEYDKNVRKANPWLLNEMSAEDIKREISQLEEQLKVIEEREEGKVDS